MARFSQAHNPDGGVPPARRVRNPDGGLPVAALYATDGQGRVLAIGGPPQAGEFALLAPGAIVVDAATGDAYTNSGTAASPIWTPPTSAPTVLFADDFETGDLSKWDGFDTSEGPVFPPYGVDVVAGAGRNGAGAQVARLSGTNGAALFKQVATGLPASGVVALARDLFVPSGLPDLNTRTIAALGGVWQGTAGNFGWLNGVFRPLLALRLEIAGGAAALSIRLESRGDDDTYSAQTSDTTGIATDAWYPLRLVYDAHGADPIGTLLNSTIALAALTDSSGDVPGPGMIPNKVGLFGGAFADTPYALIDAVAVADGYQGGGA